MLCIIRNRRTGKRRCDADLSSNNGYDYMRCYFNVQEAGTEEMVLRGSKATISAIWTFSPGMLMILGLPNMYYRCYYSISLCNEFLKHCTDNAISGFTEAQQNAIKTYRAEARFLRALLISMQWTYFMISPMQTKTPLGPLNCPKMASLRNFWVHRNWIEGVQRKHAWCRQLWIRTCPRAAAWMLLARSTLMPKLTKQRTL